ncbi:hypothetical protein niasHT_005208 [Heterodera trifolii]|uniref:BolA-like protein n=1 Tax=Heterodera trifolii TaxID=157864 RepID=A0ABD2LRV7_9BILA
MLGPNRAGPTVTAQLRLFMWKIGRIKTCPIRMNAFCSVPSEGPVTIALRQKIADFFKPEHLEVECESRLHNVPKGAEKHFRVQIVSDKFNGMTQLQRQRMVNKLLAEELREKIHALRIEAKIPSEWHGKKQTPAPPCEGGEKKRRQSEQPKRQ